MKDFSAVTENLGSMLIAASWQAALLALVVATICRLAHRHLEPAWRFALWGLVFVRLAAPVLPSSVFSVANLLSSPDREFPAETSPVLISHARMDSSSLERTLAEQNSVEDPTQAVFAQQTQSSIRQFERIPVETSEPQNTRDERDASRNSQGSLADTARSGALIIWILVAVSLLARHIVIWRRISVLTREWQPVTDSEVLRILENCREQIRVRRRVALWQSDRPIGPALLGFWRPKIVLSATLLKELPSDELQMLMLHELSHVRRGDVLWDRLASLLSIVHWFNPLAWWSRSKLRESREQACDSAVLLILGRDSVKPYGHLVMSLAQHRVPDRHDPVLVGALGRPHAIERRIELIANHRRTGWMQTFLGLSMLAVFVACGLTSAQLPPPEENASAQTNPAESVEPDRSEATVPAQAGEPYVINGRCLDEEEKPLADVLVQLFRVDVVNKSRELVSKVETDSSGKFDFGELPPPVPRNTTAEVDPEYILYRTHYVIAATKSGRATVLNEYESSPRPHSKLQLKLVPAGKLTGRVTDREGKPIANANVFVRGYPNYEPIKNVMSTTTDAEGRYVLDDLPRRETTEESTQDNEGSKRFGVISEVLFKVTHPDYGKAYPTYGLIPSTVDVTLEPASTIEGTVTDRVTRKPAPGVTVELRGHLYTPGWDQTRTDDRGQYQFRNLAPGKYTLWTETPGRTCKAIEAFEVEAGKTYAHQDLELIEGSWLEGRIVDITTGKPISKEGKYRLQVCAYGPSRPKPGAMLNVHVNEAGEFAIRVAPGITYPHISPYTVWKKTFDRRQYDQGIEIKDGESVVVEFRILPEEPPEYRRSSMLHYAIPVPAEREAAQAVRRLGGWYELDEERHVVEVNMVNHITAEKIRYRNEQIDTDEVLAWLPQFPKLQRLFLTAAQVSDEGMKHVAELSELESFYAWEARNLSDRGVQHLRKLTRVKAISITNSQIGDSALQVFGELPELESLALQGTRFSDEGFSHIIKLNQLKILSIDSLDSTVSAEAISQLGVLTSLERLYLMHVPITDRELKELANLTNLKWLSVQGAVIDGRSGITDDSAEVLTRLKQLKWLQILNCGMHDESIRTLATLPELNTLILTGTEITQQTETELKEQYPNFRISPARRSR